MAIIKGYTLIELVIVVGLVSILAIGISSAALINAITATRTANTAHLRSVGDYSLNQFKQLIRNSRNIESCDSINNTISILNPDGGTTLIAIETDNLITRIASNSGVFITPSDTSITNFDITCLPTDISPTLIELSFDTQLSTTTSSREAPTLHFSTSISHRSD